MVVVSGRSLDNFYRFCILRIFVETPCGPDFDAGELDHFGKIIVYDLSVTELVKWLRDGSIISIRRRRVAQLLAFVFVVSNIKACRLGSS